MPTTTPQDAVKVYKVSDSVLDQWNRKQAGETNANIAKAHNIASATVGANLKRVQAKVDEGYTLTTEDGQEGTATLSKVDPHAIADAMVEGASIVTLRITTLDGEADRLRAQATRLREQADAKAAQADAMRDDPKVQAIASALGFDIDAWRTEVQAAQDAATEDTPEVS